MEKILIGISGGIDSAAATILLQQQGYEVIALWIDMLGSLEQRAKVVALCERLGARLIIEDVKERFEREVVHLTLSEHQAGRTPSPCAVCNVRVKWSVLSEVADREGIFRIATGHYVRIVERAGQHYVARGIDPAKDQSYYLSGLGEEILARAVMPLGEMRKSEVRQFLANEGLDELASGAESQGLCFVERGYGNFLRERLAVREGEVIDVRGEVVGRHDGYQLYTIGQKRGFESSIHGEVRRIDAANNRLEVGEPMMTRSIECDGMDFRPFDPTLPISVVVRGLGRNPKGYAHITPMGERLTIDLLDDSAWAVAEGQPVVLYCDDLVISRGGQR